MKDEAFLDETLNLGFTKPQQSRRLTDMSDLDLTGITVRFGVTQH
ncbi:MAG: hypothetical protein CM15mP49_04980 [Actinomycetota bacterium]|nr:MAG: hypothetical protein CM15mP49_04980 [Actinomycetota bacterium]